MGGPLVSPARNLGALGHPCVSEGGAGDGYTSFLPWLPGEIEPHPVFEKKPLAWEEDIELHSRFLERKVRRGRPQPGVPMSLISLPAGLPSAPQGPGRPRRPEEPYGSGGRGSRPAQPRPRQEELRLSHTRYLQQHPDGEAMVSDFLLFLLLHRPDDVVTFAAEFFGPFSVRRPPVPALRSSTPRSPFRSPRPVTERELRQARALRMGRGRNPEALLSLLRF